MSRRGSDKSNPCITNNLWRQERKLSDPVRLKQAHAEFMQSWNREGPSTPPKKTRELSTDSTSTTKTNISVNDVKIKISFDFSPPRFTNPKLANLMIDPELNRLRQKYEKRIERRRSVTIANSTLHEASGNLRKATVLDRYNPLLKFRGRVLSENTLIFMDHDDIEIEFLTHHTRKRVSFSAPVMKKRLSMAPRRPILQKQPKPIGEFPLNHMDYATFRAWRRGSRLSVDVMTEEFDEIEVKPQPHQSMMEFLKYLLAGCMKR